MTWKSDEGYYDLGDGERDDRTFHNEILQDDRPLPMDLRAEIRRELSPQGQLLLDRARR